jgi:hypothetical protein
MDSSQSKIERVGFRWKNMSGKVTIRKGTETSTSAPFFLFKTCNKIGEIASYI